MFYNQALNLKIKSWYFCCDRLTPLLRLVSKTHRHYKKLQEYIVNLWKWKEDGLITSRWMILSRAVVVRTLPVFISFSSHFWCWNTLLIHNDFPGWITSYRLPKWITICTRWLVILSMLLVCSRCREFLSIYHNAWHCKRKLSHIRGGGANDNFTNQPFALIVLSIFN